MGTPLTWLEELSQDTIDKDLMHVRVGVEDGNDITFIKYTVSLSYMGLQWDEDFGFEFSKDLQRDMDMFYAENNRIPTPEEYKELTERHLYPYLNVA